VYSLDMNIERPNYHWLSISQERCRLAPGRSRTEQCFVWEGFTSRFRLPHKEKRGGWHGKTQILNNKKRLLCLGNTGLRAINRTKEGNPPPPTRKQRKIVAQDLWPVQIADKIHEGGHAPSQSVFSHRPESKPNCSGERRFVP
jgi:hypothetical protein